MQNKHSTKVPNENLQLNSCWSITVEQKCRNWKFLGMDHLSIAWWSNLRKVVYKGNIKAITIRWASSRLLEEPKHNRAPPQVFWRDQVPYYHHPPHSALD